MHSCWLGLGGGSAGALTRRFADMFDGGRPPGVFYLLLSLAYWPANEK